MARVGRIRNAPAGLPAAGGRLQRDLGVALDRFAAREHEGRVQLRAGDARALPRHHALERGRGRGREDCGDGHDGRQLDQREPAAAAPAYHTVDGVRAPLLSMVSTLSPVWRVPFGLAVMVNDGGATSGASMVMS
jgi:hypothetical protein